MKDEIRHIKEMLESVSGCFDEIHLTDTGSTDGTLDFALSGEAKDIAKCPIYLKTFEWCDDFAKARNFSMQGVKTDYVMWMDLDDRLSSTQEFKLWRDNVMGLHDFHLAVYNYAFDDNGNPICQFKRERVIKTSKRFEWEFFIHEGMIAKEPVQAHMVTNWSINHARTKEDYEKDFQRNVSILEKRAKTEELPVRLKWYYGKELFDKGRWAEAYVWLNQVVDSPKLEHHDRILTFEYLCRACMNRFSNEENHKPKDKQDQTLLAKGLHLAMMGVTLDPNRAEFYCLAADFLLWMGRPQDALPMYAAASHCNKTGTNGFLFVSHPAYEHIPLNQMARIKAQGGDIDGGLELATKSLKKYPHPETENLLKELLNLKEKVSSLNSGQKIKTDEIVFSTLGHPYPFDEEIYKTKGIGGSETALVEVASRLKALVGHRRVVVFNQREESNRAESGVDYVPISKMHDYFSRFEPAAHFAWRHNVKLTNAPTYLWCHDLTTPGAELHSHYRKHICLSDFHKQYAHVQQGIPFEKIYVSRNGVNKDRFQAELKNENKVVFPSSPDRGLDHAISIVEKARAKSGKPLELHVYYGIEHLDKYGPPMQALKTKLEDMMKVRPWVKYHGNVDQKTLAKEMSEAVVWLYPSVFIETFCITALEAIYAKCFPLVREIGALRDTVRPFHDLGMAKLLFKEVYTDNDHEDWAEELIKVIDDRSWEKINPDLFDYSWDGVATDFMNIAGLEPEGHRPISSRSRGAELTL